MRISVLLPLAAILLTGAIAPAFAQTRHPVAPNPPPQAAPPPAAQPAAQPVSMTDAERQAYIAKAWNENRVFGADNGAFFRP